jgi:hypothetical protein
MGPYQALEHNQSPSAIVTYLLDLPGQSRGQARGSCGRHPLYPSSRALCCEWCMLLGHLHMQLHHIPAAAALAADLCTHRCNQLDGCEADSITTDDSGHVTARDPSATAVRESCIAFVELGLHMRSVSLQPQVMATAPQWPHQYAVHVTVLHMIAPCLNLSAALLPANAAAAPTHGTVTTWLPCLLPEGWSSS